MFTSTGYKFNDIQSKKNNVYTFYENKEISDSIFSDELVDQFVKKIFDIFQKIQEVDYKKRNQLWKVSDIANYAQMSHAHVRNQIVHLPFFPKAIRIKIGDSQTQSRWFPEEVKRFFLKNQNNL